MTKYFSFRGKATRSEYWGVLLLVSLVAFALIMIGGLLLITDVVVGLVLGFLILLGTVIAAAWIQLAVIARRLRDAGINPWFTLTTYIPYVGFIVLIVFGCLASEKDANGLA